MRMPCTLKLHEELSKDSPSPKRPSIFTILNKHSKNEETRKSYSRCCADCEEVKIEAQIHTNRTSFCISCKNVSILPLDNKIPEISLCDSSKYSSCSFKKRKLSEKTEKRPVSQREALIPSARKFNVLLKLPESPDEVISGDKNIKKLSSDSFLSPSLNKIIKRRLRSNERDSISSTYICRSKEFSSPTFLFQTKNLKRNSILRPYSSVFLPCSSLESSLKHTNGYREQLFELAFEVQGFDSGCDFLMDFCSKYKLQEVTVLHLLHLYSENFSSFIESQKNKLKRLLLFICQRQSASFYLDLMPLERGEASLSLFLKSLELNLFAKNMCDKSQIYQSHAYKLLSWSKGRANLLRLMELLVSLTKAPDPDLSKVFAVQGLITLSLMTSVGNEFNINILKCFACEMYRLYATLQRRDSKILFLRSIEMPHLLVVIVIEGMKEQFGLVEEFGVLPSLQDILHHLFQPLPKQGLSKFEPNDIEEYVVLLYFLLWGTIQNIRHKTSLSYRSQLMEPESMEDLPFVEKTSAVINFNVYLSNLCTNALSAKTLDYLVNIECLLELFTV